MIKHQLMLILGFLQLNGSMNQTAWEKPTVQGFGIYQDQLDVTEGFGAYLDFCLKPNTRNFDNGGGTHNFNTQFLKNYVGVTNVVYDPFQRSEAENQFALKELEKQNFDTATSNSVLNVIDSQEARKTHIVLSCRALKKGGIAYFKVFPGDETSIEKRSSGSYQSNRFAVSYQAEVEEIFGKGNVVTDVSKHMIIAYKNHDCLKSEKEFLALFQ